MALNIINLFSSICEFFVVLFFVSGFGKMRLNKKATILILAVLLIFLSLSSHIFLGKSMLIMLCSYLFCFFVTLLFKINWKTGIFASIYIFVLIGISEIIVAMPFSLIYKADLAFIQNNPFAFFTNIICSKFLSFFLAYISKKDVNIKQNLKDKKTFVLLLLLPVSSIFIIILFLRCCYIINEYWFQITMSVASLILILSNVFVFYIIEKQNELIYVKEKLNFFDLNQKNQIQHYTELYNYQNEIRTFKHDIKNRFLGLICLLEENKADEAIDAMKNSVEFLDNRKQKIVDNNIPIIDALFQAKLSAASKKGIKINYIVRTTEDIKIDEIDLCIIIGNALDNAIEATEKAEKHNKNINLKLLISNGRISLSINNLVSNDIDINNLVTSKDNKKEHGFGIKSINNIAKKHDGQVRYYCENHIFNLNANLKNI